MKRRSLLRALRAALVGGPMSVVLAKQQPASASVIPIDGEFPQASEGTQILSATITPKRAPQDLTVNVRGACVPLPDGRRIIVEIREPR